MKLLIVLTITVVCICAQEDGYKSQYAGIDIDKILNNERILSSYINCFLDKGPCTSAGRDGKKHLPDVYKTNCGKCSEDQKTLLKKSLRIFREKRKDAWEQIVDKYDPQCKHYKEFEKFLNE